MFAKALRERDSPRDTEDAEMNDTMTTCDVEKQTFNWGFCEAHDWQMYPPPPNRVFRHWPFVGELETKASKALGNWWTVISHRWHGWTVAERQDAIRRLDALTAEADGDRKTLSIANCQLPIGNQG